MANEATNNESESYDYYITTKDNPFDPKSEFDEWNVHDQMYGYNTLARLAKMEEYLESKLNGESENSIHNAALLELVRLDPLKVYEIRSYPHEAEEVVHLSESQREMLELAKNL